MNKKKYQEFNKRYDKFKNNNLPTPFWDKERQTLEFVHYDSNLDYWNNILKSNNESFDRKQKINNNLIDALEDIAGAGFYYPYTCGYFEWARATDENDKPKLKIGHTHSHSFEKVVRDLYDFPESFKISKEEEEFYSKQELKYLRRVQKYLLFIGLKDIESYKHSVKRYRSKKQKKYGNAVIHYYKDSVIKDFLSAKRNFIVIVTDHIEIYKEYEEYPNHDKRELVVDKDDNFRLFIEYTHQEIKKFKAIKNIYKNKELKDNDKVVVQYFKILERF